MSSATTIAPRTPQTHAASEPVALAASDLRSRHEVDAGNARQDGVDVRGHQRASPSAMPTVLTRLSPTSPAGGGPDTAMTSAAETTRSGRVDRRARARACSPSTAAPAPVTKTCEIGCRAGPAREERERAAQARGEIGRRPAGSPRASRRACACVDRPRRTRAPAAVGELVDAVRRCAAAVGTSIGSRRTNCGMPPRATTTCVVWSPMLTVATVSSAAASGAVTRARPNAVRSTACGAQLHLATGSR